MVSQVSTTIDPRRTAAVCDRFGLRRLLLFGSQAGGSGGEQSDVDLLAEFEPGRTPGLIGLETIRAALSEELFAGRTVDLQTPGSLHGGFRDEVLATAVPLYERG